MTVIKIKNSNVSGRIPASGDIEIAELGLNIADRKLYSKDAAGSVFEIGVAGDIPSGTTPPSAGNNIGDLYYDTAVGRLLYWDGSGWQTVVKAGGDNFTGNVTLGTDKITLNVDGSITAAGGDIVLYANGALDVTKRIACEDKIQATAASSGSAMFAGTIGGEERYRVTNTAISFTDAGDVSSSNYKVQILADGSASFAGGNISLGESGYSVLKRAASGNIPAAEAAILSSSGKFAGTPLGDTFGIQVIPQGAALNTGCFLGASGDWYFSGSGTSAGSATFAGNVDVNDIVNESGVRLYKTGGVYTRYDGTDSAASAFKVYKNGFGDAQNTVDIKATGSATFKGDITVSEPGVGSINLNNAGDIVTYRGTNTATDSLLNLRSNIGGAAVTKAQVFADGSAIFDSYLSSKRTVQGTGPETTCTLNGSSGAFPSVGVTLGIGATQAPSGTGCFLGGNGNAYFSGTTNAFGIVLNLEADDDTKYDVTTEEYTETETYTGPLGNELNRDVTKTREIRTYNGAVLDVKDRLQKADAALLALKTAALAATDFASLQTAIVTALADV